MGPRPDGRGRRAPGQGCHAGTWRQWGRDRMAAEGVKQNYGVYGTYSVNGAATGWPRKVGMPRGPHNKSNQASMGPRPDGRGRCRHAGWGGWEARRQWGRDRMAAEGWQTAPAAGPTACVNGAATGWPRKAGVRWEEAASIQSVNGAATGWPRKVCAVDEGLPHALASMGPRPDGRGRQPKGPGAGTGGLASMGPRPDGRGRSTMPRGRRPCRLRVNGAATGWPRKEVV